jgi:hypothetical protein
LLYAAAFHFFAGAVTGSVFKARSLLLVLFLVLGEAGFLAFADMRFAGIWAVINLTAIQVGYLSGVLTRGILAQAGYSIPPVDLRSPQ